MIQITGLTKVYRRGHPPALLDLTFDARPGVVVALLGAEDAGKSTALRRMVDLERGLGVALFDGRTYRRIRRPEYEIGVVFPSNRGSGHPGRRARGHLRMLAGTVGVPARRADELLEQTRLANVSDQRLRAFSPGMSRRLELAAALLGNPHTLLLDAPTDGLSSGSATWFHSFLRSFAVAGGSVVVTTRSVQEAALLGDRVITLDRGRTVADQPVAEFRRTRLHPEVLVRGPQMARLADLVEAAGGQVHREGGTGLAVSGLDRTEIGELAYRNGILLHELADQVVEQPVPEPVRPTGSGRSGHIQVHGHGPGAVQDQAPQHPEPQAQSRTAATRVPSPANPVTLPSGGEPAETWELRDESDPSGFVESVRIFRTPAQPEPASAQLDPPSAPPPPSMPPRVPGPIQTLAAARSATTPDTGSETPATRPLFREPTAIRPATARLAAVRPTTDRLSAGHLPTDGPNAAPPVADRPDPRGE